MNRMKEYLGLNLFRIIFTSQIHINLMQWHNSSLQDLYSMHDLCFFLIFFMSFRQDNQFPCHICRNAHFVYLPLATLQLHMVQFYANFHALNIKITSALICIKATECVEAERGGV